MNPKDKKEYVLCSAIWYKLGEAPKHKPINTDTGVVACGLRHGDCFGILMKMFPERDHVLKNKDGRTTIQGFLTSKNRFVTREEASKIAFENGQTEKDDGCLFSEDLY